jgi:hypothetical protein
MEESREMACCHGPEEQMEQCDHSTDHPAWPASKIRLTSYSSPS